MTKLTERALVKDILGISRMDLSPDPILNGMIETASNEAELWCRRKFPYAVRQELHQRYAQSIHNPDPQYIWLDGPLDPTCR